MGVSFFGHLFPKRSLVRIDQLEERARLRAHFGGPPIGGRRFPVFRLQGTQLDEAKELREVPAALPCLVRAGLHFVSHGRGRVRLGGTTSPRQTQCWAWSVTRRKSRGVSILDVAWRMLCGFTDVRSDYKA